MTHVVRVCARHQSLSRSTEAQSTELGRTAKGESDQSPVPGYAPGVDDALRWADRLESLAGPVLADMPRAGEAGGAAFARSFRDSAGICRVSDAALFGRLLGFDPGPIPSHAGPSDRVWWALFDDGIQWESLVSTGDGPLLPALREEGIETWTEAELSALHALWHLARRRDSAEIRERCARAVAWHLAEVQPDNATNRPWAVHAFVLAARRHPDAILHARTLVHNAMVERGRPERFAALLLVDAADALRQTALGHRGTQAF